MARSGPSEVLQHDCESSGLEDRSYNDTMSEMTTFRGYWSRRCRLLAIEKIGLLRRTSRVVGERVRSIHQR